MSLKHIADHIAAQGRHGDSTLVHVSKGELAGLQALAHKNGTTLTTNPQTGLPEAFGLRNLLPMAAGAALTIGSGGTINPVTAGLIVGGVSGLASGSLKQGMMDGLGAWGGAGLGAGIGAGAAGTAGTAGTVGTAAQTAVPEVAANTVSTTGTMGSQVPGGTLAENYTWDPLTKSNVPIADPATSVSYQNGADLGGAGSSPANTGVNAATGAPAAPGASSLNYQNGADLGGAGSSPANMGAAGKSAFQQFAANVEANPRYLMGALAPAIGEELFKKPEVAQPKSQGDADMGQRYQFSPSSQYTAPRYVPISNEAAKKLYGYAEGGPVANPFDFAHGGDAVVRMDKGGEAGKHQAIMDAFNRDYGGIRAAALGASAPFVEGKFGGAQQEPTQQYAYHPDDQSYTNMAAGGIAHLASGGFSKEQTQPYKEMATGRLAPFMAPMLAGMSGANVVGLDNKGSPVYGGGVMDSMYRTGEDEQNPYGVAYAPGSREFDNYKSTLASYSGGAAQGGLMQSYAQGGISTLGSYSDGGRLLKGPGDGMSDNIPAQIGQKQPARLADGEFVVPADVVSHLGNGSTDAGAKQLYKMMDKVRAARTGRKSQGKQINPHKYMPA